MLEKKTLTETQKLTKDEALLEYYTLHLKVKEVETLINELKQKIVTDLTE